jgi:hypothetical protein
MRSPTFRREQRLALWLLLAIGVLVIVIGVPLVISGSLRLRIAYDLGIAPGKVVPKIAGADPNIALITVTVNKPDAQGRPIQTALALYIATTTPDGITLQDLNQPRTLRVPLDHYDLVSADADASHLLFVADESGGTKKAVLVTVKSGQVAPLPAGQTAPNLPGDWTTPIWQTAAVGCNSASPGFTFVACVQGPKLAAFFAGDWQIEMLKYGDIDYGFSLFRGLGAQPIGGWAQDDRTFYFQNERGIWKATVLPDELKRR